MSNIRHIKRLSGLVFGTCATIASATPGQPNEQCVIQEKTVHQNQVRIEERSTIRRDIVPTPDGGKKCLVDFRVRVGTQWHTAMGEFSWRGGQRTEHEACIVAVDRAMSAVRDRLASGQVIGERTVICKDRPELRTMQAVKVGDVGDVGQFLPHPQYRDRFWHNGSVCKWFSQPITGGGLEQGVICEVRTGQWLVVDKF